MRWKESAKPEVLDTRIIRKFLLLPKKIGDETRWLESAWIKQVYTLSWFGPAGSDFAYMWKDQRWVDD